MRCLRGKIKGNCLTTHCMTLRLTSMIKLSTSWSCYVGANSSFRRSRRSHTDPTRFKKKLTDYYFTHFLTNFNCSGSISSWVDRGVITSTHLRTLPSLTKSYSFPDIPRSEVT